MSFSKNILSWYHQHKRALPWRETKNPYTIWLSEIILQQTRVEQGMPYFLKFIEAYPTVTKFAEAKEDELLRLWQGLGYYSRARNMHKASKLVLEQFQGQFPTSYLDLLKLPGVGEYTAAAISSFSVNAAHAVLDGNVFRVLSRYFGIDEAINSTLGKKIFSELAQDLLDPDSPGEYNQAIMDFGALQCKPKNPNCEECIFRLDCVAFKEAKVDLLPRKIKGKKSKKRYFHYFVIESEGKILMTQRGDKDVWANLYELPMLETVEPVSLEGLLQSAEYQGLFGDEVPQLLVGPIKHILSHQSIFATFYQINIENTTWDKKNEWNYFLSENIDKLAKHKLMSSFFEHYYFSAN